MRVGLLTRFLGIIGAIAGAMPLIGGFFAPQLAAFPILQVFWLGAVGALILGRWPGGNVPPAWTSGRPEPWPTQQEIREQRERELAAAKAGKGRPEEAEDAPLTPAPVPRGADDGEETAGAAHSSSKKKKRKRR